MVGSLRRVEIGKNANRVSRCNRRECVLKCRNMLAHVYKIPGFVILVISPPPECLYIMNMHRRPCTTRYITYIPLPTTVRPSSPPLPRHSPPRLITAPQYQSVTAAAVLSRSTTERAINHFGAGRTRTESPRALDRWG